MPGKKVSIIGAGNVGATAAYYIAEKVIANGGQVVVVPKGRMPSETGLAAIYRF